MLVDLHVNVPQRLERITSLVVNVMGRSFPTRILINNFFLLFHQLSTSKSQKSQFSYFPNSCKKKSLRKRWLQRREDVACIYLDILDIMLCVLPSYVSLWSYCQKLTSSLQGVQSFVNTFCPLLTLLSWNNIQLRLENWTSLPKQAMHFFHSEYVL